MKEVIIKIDSENSLLITGNYSKAEPDTGMSASFEIEMVENLQKDIYNVLEWANSLEKGIALEVLEYLCLDKIKEE